MRTSKSGTDHSNITMGKLKDSIRQAAGGMHGMGNSVRDLSASMAGFVGDMAKATKEAEIIAASEITNEMVENLMNNAMMSREDAYALLCASHVEAMWWEEPV